MVIARVSSFKKEGGKKKRKKRRKKVYKKKVGTGSKTETKQVYLTGNQTEGAHGYKGKKLM